MSAAKDGERPPSGWRQWVPRPARTWWRRIFRRRVFQGNYSGWAEACAVAGGYDDPGASARVIAAARGVREGRALWDRDGVLFSRPMTHEPLVSALRRVALDKAGALDVVDFGGGLGSTWWQHRSLLREYRVSWRVVERPQLVEAGRREFSDAVLSFYPTLVEALSVGPTQVILLSSVLSYLQDPHALVREVVKGRIPHVIVDRTPFIAGKRDRLAVQSAPREIGGGRYPCHLFNRDRLFAAFQADYELAEEWSVPFDQADGGVTYRGVHFRLRATASASPNPAAK